MISQGRDTSRPAKTEAFSALAGQVCEWFVLCSNEVTHYEPHPILGPFPACDRCMKVVDR